MPNNVVKSCKTPVMKIQKIVWSRTRAATAVLLSSIDAFFHEFSDILKISEKCHCTMVFVEKSWFFQVNLSKNQLFSTNVAICCYLATFVEKLVFYHKNATFWIDDIFFLNFEILLAYFGDFGFTLKKFNINDKYHMHYFFCSMWIEANLCSCNID